MRSANNFRKMMKLRYEFNRYPNKPTLFDLIIYKRTGNFSITTSFWSSAIFLLLLNNYFTVTVKTSLINFSKTLDLDIKCGLKINMTLNGQGKGFHRSVWSPLFEITLAFFESKRTTPRTTWHCRAGFFDFRFLPDIYQKLPFFDKKTSKITGI